MKISRSIKILVIILITVIAILIILVTNISGIKKSINSNENSAKKVGVSVSSNEKKEDDNIPITTEMKIDAMPLKMLNNNSWDRVKAKFSEGYKIDENGNYVHDEGFVLYCDGTNVQNIVFNTNYKESVVGGVTVGTSLKKIISNFGTPTFQQKSLGMIGYKIKDLYVFFYENEISIYPNKLLNNVNFESILSEYYKEVYNGNRTNFVLEIKRTYPDFTATEDNENIILRSVNRQIEIILGNDKNIKIIIYNGYKPDEFINAIKESSDIIIEKTDLAEKQEMERKLAK